MKSLLAIAAVSVLSGCATQSMYEWGGYEQLLYQSYKDPVKVEAMRIGLETQIASLEEAGLKVAPGLYAELGTLYLQAGAEDKAINMYEKERDAWPESRGLMNAMIGNLQRQKDSAGRVK